MFRVSGLELRVQGLRLESGCRVKGVGFRVQGSGFDQAGACGSTAVEEASAVVCRAVGVDRERRGPAPRVFREGNVGRIEQGNARCFQARDLLWALGFGGWGFEWGDNFIYYRL